VLWQTTGVVTNGQYKYIYAFTNKIIPISALIVRQLKIKDGDKLDWECLVEKERNHREV
jgi:hypothetical protein